MFNVRITRWDETVRETASGGALQVAVRITAGGVDVLRERVVRDHTGVTQTSLYLRDAVLEAFAAIWGVACTPEERSAAGRTAAACAAKLVELHERMQTSIREAAAADRAAKIASGELTEDHPRSGRVRAERPKPPVAS